MTLLQKFVKELHELHEEWLIRRQTQLSTPVLVRWQLSADSRIDHLISMIVGFWMCMCLDKIGAGFTKHFTPY